MTPALRGYSMRRRLLLTLLAALLVSWTATAWQSYRDARHEVDEIFDAELVQSARLLLAIPGPQPSPPELEGLPEADGLRHPYERKLHGQLWDADQRLLYRTSRVTPSVPLSSRDEGFEDRWLAGRRWRVFVLWNADRTRQAQLGQMLEVREELAGAVTFHLLLPLLLGLPLMGALVWWLVGRGLWPVRHLAAQLEGVSPEHLQPVSAARYPVEMLPILGALNGLLQRLDRALQLERQFTADAAHELRTPLAGIRAQAQVAQRALEPEVRERALRQVVAGVDRQTQLVTQLLQLARLEPGAVLEPSTPQNLRVLVEEVLRDAVPAALEKGITLEFEEGPAPQVAVRPELFRVLLRNLVDNALRYTPAGGRVLLWLDASGDRTQLSVEDSGPGIPLEERERVFDRFYRRVGSGESGSGLGLAIVRRVAELLSVQVRLDTARSGQGLWVRVDFPQT